MGIKGIYNEIGPGKRVSICKLAVEHLEQTGKPLRVAIDISIWQFQVQAARGGANPAIRTLFYRLVRLLGLGIQPIFVFDGPAKPLFKRNKRSSRTGGGSGDGVATALAKRLIALFGFAAHDAPGEAEAECALLQRAGVVDAVLSEDVDTIMFGCARTLRNWSAEGGQRGNKTPTHVSLYDSAECLRRCGLDREGMVLVALMSGGDYLPAGVPGIGVKVACEAARAGFGKTLCGIKRADPQALVEWRANLLHELRTNESGFFKTRHKALPIPDDFPNMEVLRYYTHPVVSTEATVGRLKQDFPPVGGVDVQGLREFVRDTFDWTYKGGAIKFIRVLAPSMLTQAILSRAARQPAAPDELPDQAKNAENSLVKSISGRRSHFSTDSTPELRISYVPADMVTLDLEAEEQAPVATYGRSGLALNSDDEEDQALEEAELGEAEGEGETTASPQSTFDPLKPNLAWIPESVAKLGVPVTVEDWEEQQRTKAASKASKAVRSKTQPKAGPSVATLDRWLSAGLPSLSLSDNVPPTATSTGPRFISTRASSALVDSPAGAREQPKTRAATTRSKQSKPTNKHPAQQPAAADKPAVRNPWTLSGSQTGPRITKPAAAPAAADPILIPSSPVVLPASPAGAFLKPVAGGSVHKEPAAGKESSGPSPSRGPQSPSKDASGTRQPQGASQRRSGRSAKPVNSASGAGAAPRELIITNFGPSSRMRLPVRSATDAADRSADKTVQDQSQPAPPRECIRLPSSSPLPVSPVGSTSPQRGFPTGDGKAERKAGDSPVRARTKILILRDANHGFYETVEVGRGEVDRVLHGETSLVGGGKGSNSNRPVVLRLSDVSIIDLTGKN